MKIYFSPSTLGFYLEGINDTVPDDTIEVTQAERDAVIAAANREGMQLAADENGRPVAASLVLAVEEQLAALRRKRDRLLAASDKTQVPDFPITPEQRQQWSSYRQTLRAMPELYAADPASAVWPTPPTGGVL